MKKLNDKSILFAVTQSKLPLFLNRKENRGICT